LRARFQSMVTSPATTTSRFSDSFFIKILSLKRLYKSY
jgi:hypothetical protein